MSGSGALGQTQDIRILVRDGEGRPAPAAEIEITAGAKPIGRIFTGSGVEESVVSVGPLSGAPLKIRVTFNGITKEEALPPNQNSMQFDFDSFVILKAKLNPRVTCPNGTSGYPCVVCSDGAEVWQICT